MPWVDKLCLSVRDCLRVSREKRLNSFFVLSPLAPGL